SYGSQGKTVDHVLFADSAIRAATNAQQWYVTISRGRKGVRIFTPDKRELRRAILRTGDRELALNLLPNRSQRYGIRQRLLRSVRRGREFARRVCLLATRYPSTGATQRHSTQSNETQQRQTNRPVRSRVLAP
nr:hypothetical protein [Verrucomicrobiota bacterium]